MFRELARESEMNANESSAKEKRENYSNSFLIVFFIARTYFSILFSFVCFLVWNVSLQFIRPFIDFCFSALLCSSEVASRSSRELSESLWYVVIKFGREMIIVCRVVRRKEEEMWFKCNAHESYVRSCFSLRDIKLFFWRSYWECIRHICFEHCK